MMDLMPRARADEDQEVSLSGLELVVLQASAEELAAHQLTLDSIDKASMGACLWKKLQVQ
jgi:DNA polymerase-3 subunit epsilon